MKSSEQLAEPETSAATHQLSSEDSRTLEALRLVYEQAFASLIDRYYSHLLRLAMAYVPSRGLAEEVVQETWLGVVAGSI